MANIDAPFGLKPIRTLGGEYTGATNNYLIADNLNVANGLGGIFTGDLVIPVATGGIDGVAAAPTLAMQGVFAGCEYVDPASGKYTYNSYYPDTTNITQGVITAHVIDDPMVVFEIQADGILTAADVNFNCTLLITDGNTQDGQSKSELDHSEVATTSTDPLKIIGLGTDPERSDETVANGVAVVVINHHSLKSVGTVGI